MSNCTPTLSIIIPTLNEAANLPLLLDALRATCLEKEALEIIVVDGGSTDNTLQVAKTKNSRLYNSARGRAVQMNYGARKATGDFLYFLHADTLPPVHFDQKIIAAINNRQRAGCFRMKFDSKNPMLRFFAFCTRFNFLICRGGDQSLFIEKSLFDEIGGFNEAYKVYEDVEIIKRLRRKTKFKIIPAYVVTSARRYQQKGWLKLQYHFGIIHLKNFLGRGPEQLLEYYEKKVAT